jgi:hypothetical protein
MYKIVIHETFKNQDNRKKLLHMVCFIVLYAEAFPTLRPYTVIYVLYIMICFFEIHEDRKGFYT